MTIGRTAAAAALILASAPALASPIGEAIARHAREHGVPETLVHRIVKRESGGNPRLTHGRYYGLMQISLPTARSMGYRGAPAGLLDADTNLTYAVPYLANAWLAAGRDEGRAVSLYAGGYYYAAKRKHLLGQLHTAHAGVAREAPQPTPDLPPVKHSDTPLRDLLDTALDPKARPE